MSAVDTPPPTNPVLSAYQGFVSTTPLVTRYVIWSVCASYATSWVADPNMALANIPLFTVQKLELYRVVTAPLLCDSLLNLIFAYLSFVENGQRLEYAMGSSAFASLLGVLAFVINLIHILFCYVVYFLTHQEAVLLNPAASIWIVVLALIAAECSKAPRDSKRKLFIVQVPTLYYPLAILAIFTLFSGGLQVPFLFAVLVGYAQGFDKLAKLQVGSNRVSRWESNGGCLSNFTRRPGWVFGHAAQGSGAWNNTGSDTGGGHRQQQTSAWTPSTFRSAQASNKNSSTGAGSGGTMVRAPEPEKVKETEFPKGRGQALGGQGTAADPQDARRARLAALERRRGDNNV